MPNHSPRVSLSTKQVTFRNTKRYQHQKELFVAAEGTYTGQVRNALVTSNALTTLPHS